MNPRTRLTWDELPGQVRMWAQQALGSPVVRVDHASGGYSPGTTDALFCADGSRGFLKAVHPSINPHSPGLIRSERQALERLPAGLPIAGLIAAFDEGPDGWVAILIEHVAGEQPPLPWTNELIGTVLAALRVTESVRVPDLRDAVDALRPLLELWPGLVGRADLDPWLAARLPALDAAARRALASAAGETLLHLDLRADNLLRRPDGTIAIVDWAWAARGASWVDPAGLIIEFISSGSAEVDADAWLDRIATDQGVPPTLIADFLAGALGYFESAGRAPDPPGLPTVREFQRFQASALRGWLRSSRHTGQLGDLR